MVDPVRHPLDERLYRGYAEVKHLTDWHIAQMRREGRKAIRVESDRPRWLPKA